MSDDTTPPREPRDGSDPPADPWLRAAAVLAAIAVVTGAGLLFVYRPGPNAALSLVDLAEATSFGRLRDTHLWASHALLVVGFLALARAFVLGADRRRRRWASGVALFVVTIALAATGWMLPGRTADPLPVYAVHCFVLPLVAAFLAFRGRSGRGEGAGSS